MSRQTLAAATSFSSRCDSLRVLARLERPQMGHLLVGGVLDDRGALLERRYAQQPVVIGRLLAGRYPQPLVIGVELLRHGCLGSPQTVLPCDECNDTQSSVGAPPASITPHYDAGDLGVISLSEPPSERTSLGLEGPVVIEYEYT